ncbi:MAG: leucine-rich repeat domain-containing protein [Bacteroidales bacterium]|nr:leucine-rich repeat domain-containing protein [Bacteroidales bacterium]
MKRVLLFVLLLAICTFHALAYDFTATCPSGQTLYYTIRDASQHAIALVAPNDEHYPPYQGYTSPQGAIELSATVEHEGTTYTLVEIGPYALGYLSSDVHGDIVIPNTVTLIGKQAFSHSYFDGTITIGDHVVTIRSSAFNSTFCHGSVVLPSSVRTIEKYAFSENEYLDGELILNEGLESIGERAFFRCPSFQGPLRLPSTLTYLDDFCFAYCSGFTGELVIPEGIETIPDYAFSHCSGIESLSFRGNISRINSRAFEYCSGLSGTLNLPSTITYTGAHAFSYCSGFTHLILPDTFYSFNSGCFRGCTGLSGDIVIPQGTTSIPNETFAGCINIEHVQFPQSLTVIGSDAFAGCTSLSDLQLPNGLKTIKSDAFDGCISLEGELILPESLTSIDDRAFFDCAGLTGTLIIPDKVQKVGFYAFEGCSNLGPEAIIGSSVLELGQRCFYDTGITHLTFRSTTPPYANYGMGLDSADCTVPCGTVSEYINRFGDHFTDYEEGMVFRYNVVSNDLTLGNVAIVETPVCDNNAHLVAIANPLPEKVFSHWTVNGNMAGNDTILSITVERDCEVMAHFLGGAGMEEAAIQIEIHPTITSNIIRVNADHLLYLEIYDLNGRCVAHSEESQIDLSNLSSGCYIARARLKEGEAIRKVIKM